MLNVSSDQKTQILDPIDSKLQDAFAEGVEAGSVQFLAGIQKYTDMTPEQQQLVKDTFKLVVAAMLVSMNVKKPLPDSVTNGSGFTGFIPYIDGTTFSTMNLIVQDGIIVGVTG